MKKSMIAVALLGAFGASAAFAQSNVTVYGRVNNSFERIKVEGDDPTTGAKSDLSKNALVNNASRIGFRGTEDLGGGMSALFQIESRFESDSTGGTLASRDTFVGLGSKDLGTIKLGVLTSPLYYTTHDYISMVNHDTGNTGDALLWFPAISTPDFFARNSIQYTSPTIAGFTFEGMYSLMRETRTNVGAVGTTSKEGHYSIAISYDNGPLHVGGGYGQSKQEKLGAAEAKDSAWVISALYDLKSVVVGGLYERDKVENGGTLPLTGVLATGEHDRNYWRLVAMVPMGANEFHVNYGQAGDWSNSADNGAKQLTLGWNYNLSKRTKVYAFYTRLDNDSRGNLYTFASGLPAGSVNVLNTSLAAGLRHNF